MFAVTAASSTRTLSRHCSRSRSISISSSSLRLLTSSDPSYPLITTISTAPRHQQRRHLTQTIPRRYADTTADYSPFSNPAHVEAQKALNEGTHALERGDLEEARKAYERSNAIEESSTTHYNLGVVHFQRSDLSRSIDSFRRSIQLAPPDSTSSADAHTNLASAYVMSSPARPDLAIEHLQRALRIEESRATASASATASAVEEHDHEDAHEDENEDDEDEEDEDEPVVEGGKDGEIWFNLGAILEACERLEESAKAYEKAKELGIERAGMNLRNVMAKILSVKIQAKAKANNYDQGQAQGQGQGQGGRGGGGGGDLTKEKQKQ